MKDPAASDFFGALALELRAASQRAPRRTIGTGRAVGTLAAIALMAAVVLIIQAIAGGGSAHLTAASKPDRVGTVIPKGEGKPPREADSTVLATGTAPLLGPWQMETHWGKALKDPKSGKVYNPAGPCLMVYPLDPPARTFGASGFCGPARDLGFRRTPGFSRAQLNVPAPGRRADGTRVRVKEVLVYGRVPERAAAVVITSDTVHVRAVPHEGPESIRGDYYGIAVRPPLEHGRINWLDADGKPGSRGIRLMPPLNPMHQR